MEDSNLQDFAVVCDHIFKDERPIRLVVRHGDGSWQMTCGFGDHREDAEGAQVVHVHHLFERQRNLAQFQDLQPGFLADFVDGDWHLSAHDD